MKKLLTGLICAVMILAMLPALPLTVRADGEGDFDTYRSALDYADPRMYTPAAGYRYTEEGLQTLSPDYSAVNPYFNVQTRKEWNAKDGLSMEIRVDEFAYKGERGEADEWIAFSLWNQQNLTPGSAEYGGGWLCLIKGNGDGSAVVQSFWTDPKTGESNGSFTIIDPNNVNVPVDVPMDEKGREHYTFSVDWDGSGYSLKVNGVETAGSDKASAMLQALKPDGRFYVGVTMQTGAYSTEAALTILDFNGRVPTGSDAKEPEENPYYEAPIADPSTVPENMPCMLFDASFTDLYGMSKAGMRLTPRDDLSFRCVPDGNLPWIPWVIPGKLSYDADDFPYFAMMTRGCLKTSGTVYYVAQNAIGETPEAPWSVDGEYSKTYGADPSCVLVVAKLVDDPSDGWHTRYYSVTPAFPGLAIGEWGAFDLLWMGLFRSGEEAQAYADAYMAAHTPETEPPIEETTAASETEAPTEPVTEAPAETPAADVTQTPAADVPDPVLDGTAVGETGAAEASGCEAVTGGAAALILTALAAAAAWRRRE